jgi:ring-1,2-phenylacetyl-CoA epoxidase subunit PaaD
VVSPSVARAWEALAGVPDPEVPVLSLVDLGIVRTVEWDEAGRLSVSLTPTYSGCPATEVIAEAVEAALHAAGFEQVNVSQRLSPAWTSDWLGAEAREKLRRYGIAPPAHLAGGAEVQGTAAPRPLRFHPRGITCPRCDSGQVEQLSAFGSTACKALYRCLACREPFDYFKPI